MDEQLDELTGILERVVFQSPENGFTIARVAINAKELCTVAGYLPNIHQGERVALRGSWGHHPKFGRQFEVKECKAQLPASAEGIRKYLSSGLIKGIGAKYAGRLVDRFGAQTLEVIDKQPQRLFEVGGIGSKRVALIAEAWQEQKEISNVMVFLQEKDISTDFAVKIFKTYGQQSIAKIQENPYRLVDDIYGVGFKSADKVALKLGFEPDSLYRIKSGIVFAISEALGSGHLYIDVEDAKKKAIELLMLQGHPQIAELLKRALHELYDQEKIVLISHQEQHYISLPQYYHSERGIAKKIKFLSEAATHGAAFDLDEVYRSLCLPDARGVQLNELQQRGVIACLQHKVVIITGGPGTGKTTMIRRLLDILEQGKKRVKLAAPTGRAAKRMFEGTGRSAETLHRLLEFNPAGGGFARTEQNALELDVLVVDEASMIDVFLMHALLRAMPQRAHLVLIGDVDQLPSVGAGNVLNDLIDSEKVTVIRLNEIFRQAQDSMIIVNAHRMNHGEFPLSSQPGSRNDFKFIKEQEPENIFALLRQIYTGGLQRRGIAPEDAVVLCPMNRGLVGTQRINQELQLILNPTNDEEKQVARFGQVYKVGDRVMQVRNNYDKFVFNGDMGVIEDIDRADQELQIRFGERSLAYDFSELNEIVLAYAISIHKSQGSEFRAVIVPVFMQHFIMLQRNLLYTAVTRAKELCLFVGEPKAIAMGINNNKGVKRVTFLKEFLTTDLEAR